MSKTVTTMPSICNVPSAAAAPSVPAPPPASTGADADSPCSRLLITYLEKRTRNLDKRKAKLDGYLQKESAGEKLDRDQKEALKQLPVVVGMIECLKETTDHVIKTISEEEKKLEKQQRKVAKRQQVDSQKQTISLFFEFMKLQQLLEHFNSKDLTENAKNSSLGFSDDELNNLNLLQQMVSPSIQEKSDLNKSLSENAESTVNYLQGKDGSFSGCDFKVFREIVKRVEDSKFLIADTEEKFEEKNVKETTMATTEEAVHETVEASSLVSHDVNAITHTLTSQCQPLLVEEIADKTVHMGIADTHSSGYHPLSSNTEVPMRPMKEPQEILSAVCGSYNFLQESEIEEPERTEENLQGHGFSTFEPYVPIPSGFSVAPTHGVLPDPHQLLVQQPVPFSGNLLTLPYPQNLVNESIYMAHGLPAGYGNGMAMTTPYTMHDAYSQPIVSHELNGLMVPTTAYFGVANPMVVGHQEVEDQAPFETLDVAQTDSIETTELTGTATEIQQHEEEEKQEATANEPEKKKFSMNPNADVFRSKNYPDADAEFVASENAQGGFGGRRNGRGGRGGRMSHQGYQGRGNHRGQVYGGRGGGYSRYPRNDYRQDGQNGYANDYNSWQNGPRRGRGGHPRGRGGRGGYDRNEQQSAGDEVQE